LPLTLTVGIQLYNGYEIMDTMKTVAITGASRKIGAAKALLAGIYSYGVVVNSCPINRINHFFI
tara:strand:+ start:2266 stop:2457 length:192 start_codon:yes stop_codon:yes gene_type:complete